MITLIALGLVHPTLVRADEDEGFDSLVKELKSSLKEDVPLKRVESESSQMEFGGGVVGSYVAVNENSSSAGVMLTGFDLHLGIDLLTDRWLAETSFRSFSTSRVGQDAVSMQDYDIKVIRKSNLQRNLWLRLGGGVAAQFLKTSGPATGDQSQQAPSVVALIGVEKVLSKKFSVGTDASYRLPVIADTSERGSGDATLRLNFLF